MGHSAPGSATHRRLFEPARRSEEHQCPMGPRNDSLFQPIPHHPARYPNSARGHAGPQRDGTPAHLPVVDAPTRDELPIPPQPSCDGIPASLLRASQHGQHSAGVHGIWSHPSKAVLAVRPLPPTNGMAGPVHVVRISRSDRPVAAVALLHSPAAQLEPGATEHDDDATTAATATRLQQHLDTSRLQSINSS